MVSYIHVHFLLNFTGFFKHQINKQFFVLSIFLFFLTGKFNSDWEYLTDMDTELFKSWSSTKLIIWLLLYIIFINDIVDDIIGHTGVMIM